jgi:DNA-binding MarR family transcriptional regulator
MAEEEKQGNWADLSDVDRIIHEPARLTLMTILYAVQSADFLYLLRESGLTKGNLSAHLSKLEDAGYIKITKSFNGKVPHTDCQLTAKGRKAFDAYVAQMRGALGS